MKITIAVLMFSMGFQGQSIQKSPSPNDNAARPTGYVSKTGDFTSSILTMFSDIVTKGGGVWDKIGASQAQSVLQGVASDAATLENKNNQLRTDLEASVERHTTQDFPVTVRSEELKTLLRALGRTLERFRVEIDKSAHPIGEEMRVNFSSQVSAKETGLSGVEDMWRQGRYQDAIKQLDEATAHLEKMRAIVLCLQNSITAKSASCDPKTLEPLSK